MGTISTGDNLVKTIVDTMDEQHGALFEAAKERLSKKTFHINSYETMKEMIEKAGNGDIESAGFYLAPWKCSETMKKQSRLIVRLQSDSIRSNTIKQLHLKGQSAFTVVKKLRTWPSLPEHFSLFKLHLKEFL